MPAKSAKQKRFFGLVRAIQEGKAKPGYASSAAKHAARSMTPRQVSDYASTSLQALRNARKNRRKGVKKYD